MMEDDFDVVKCTCCKRNFKVYCLKKDMPPGGYPEGSAAERLYRGALKGLWVCWFCDKPYAPIEHVDYVGDYDINETVKNVVEYQRREHQKDWRESDIRLWLIQHKVFSEESAKQFEKEAE